MSVSRTITRLSYAAIKNASARLRGLGLLQPKVDWPARATICERCPLRVIEKKISYCGRPFLQQVTRDETTEGCGCPVRAKAMDPGEHCPITPRHTPATRTDDGCTCKWCATEPASSQSG